MPAPMFAHLLATAKKKPAVAGGVGLAAAAGAAVYMKKRKATASTGAAMSTVTVPGVPRTADTTATDLASAFQGQFDQLQQEINALGQTPASPVPPPAGTAPGSAPAPGGGGGTNMSVLKSLQDAGYTETGVKNLDAANKAGVAPPPPSVANGPGGPVNWALLSAWQAQGGTEAGLRAIGAQQNAAKGY